MKKLTFTSKLLAQSKKGTFSSYGSKTKVNYTKQQNFNDKIATSVLHSRTKISSLPKILKSPVRVEKFAKNFFKIPKRFGI